MIQAAISQGLGSIGFSGHAYAPFSPYCAGKPDLTQAYKTEIRRLQAKYQDQLKIYLGLELDYYSNVDLTPYEYYIGSVHHYLDPITNEFYTFDGSPETFIRAYEAGCGSDILTLARIYYDLVVQTITQPRAGRRPDIVGHFNLITKRNADHKLIDETDPAYKAIAFEALRACAETDAVFEINTGAIARGYGNVIYPNLEMLQFLHQHGARIMINSDCHNAKDLNCAFDVAIDLAKAAGYRSAVVLGQNSLFEEVGLDEIR